MSCASPQAGKGPPRWEAGPAPLRSGVLPPPGEGRLDVGPESLPALGVDFGSRAVKLVYGAGGRLVRRVVDSLEFYRRGLLREEGGMRLNWPWLRWPPTPAVVVTGYGKELLKKHFATVTEVRASFLGAKAATGRRDFLLLEMGGQDTKVLLVQDGRVFDFLTNDRCAAGTGRYLENMARFLKMPLREFARAWEDPVEISQTCAIFGESELIGYLLTGVAPARLAAGVNASVARRALALVRRYPPLPLVLAGGVAKNRAVVHLLAAAGRQVVVPPYPQFLGALGCYLEARGRQAREAP